MALGDGIRRNIKDVDPIERGLLKDAFVELNNRFFGGTRTDTPTGGVSWWFKQDEIHQATHVHNGPEFLPWHREIVNRLEVMLRQINPQLSLHYWDWKENPTSLPNANLGGGTTGTLNLFTTSFMGYGGSSSNSVGEPWLSAGYYNPGAANKRDNAGGTPADPPGDLRRNVSGSPATALAENNAIGEDDYAAMRVLMEDIHDNMHGFVNMGGAHISFRDPFVFLLHSNVDRVFAKWQWVNGKEARLNGNTMYGTETNLDVVVGGHTQNVNHMVEPWSTGHSEDLFGTPHDTRPWHAPENEGVPHTYKDFSIVNPPCYDTLPASVVYETTNVDFGNIPAGLTSFRAARVKVKSCHKVKLRITQNPTGNFGLTPMGTVFTYDPHINGVYGDAFVWIQFTANGSGLQTTTIKVQAFEDIDPANPHNIGAEQTITFTATPLARIDNSVVMVLDRSGSMAANAGGTSTRTSLMKSAVGVFATLMRSTDEIGLVSFDDQVATLLPMTPQSAGLVQVITVLVGNGLDPRGATGIGIGIIQGNSVLTGANAAFNKTMLVLTDGNENVHPYVNELPPGTVNTKTYAIGFGLPADVSTPVLHQITNNTNGDLVVTGNITTEEQRFLLTKYFVQVLNGINNNQVILDPQGNLLWGATHKIPFVVSETDISMECIALCPVPLLLSFKLETPDGKIITPSMSGVQPNIKYVNGKEVAFYRIMLPALPANPAGSHAGTWKAILEIKSKDEIEQLIRKEKINIRQVAAILKGMLPYNFMAQCYSNLTFTAKSMQTSLEPGAVISLEAVLKEYDMPVEKRASVTAQVIKPDGNTSALSLLETAPGIFTADYKTGITGNYSFRIMAAGSSFKGKPFTREKTVTGGVFIGGDRYDDNSNHSSLIDWLNERDKRFCELLNCIFAGKALQPKFEKKMLEEGIDLKQLRECLKKYCTHRKHHGGREQVIDAERALADVKVKAAVQKLSVAFNNNTFGFAALPAADKKAKGKATTARKKSKK